ncbi:WapI family immunity protein [Streptomyces sp. NPDC002309]
MRLSDRAGGIVLRPICYEFPAVSGDPWDDNWLVVEAEVTTPVAKWSFTDACLQVDEAQEVSAWLRAVADGRRPDARPDAEGQLAPDLSFVEPVLAFSQVRWQDGTGVLRVHLSLEAAPPWQQDPHPDLHQYVIEVETGRAELIRAAEAWDQYLARFPRR